jgi:TonB family protein
MRIAAFHDWYSLDRYRARLTLGITLSLLAHALLLSLQFGLPGIGLPSLALPWNQRRAQADLSIVLAPVPAHAPVEATTSTAASLLPEVANPPAKPARSGFVLTQPATKPAPKELPKKRRAPARHATKKPVRKKLMPKPSAELPPVTSAEAGKLEPPVSEPVTEPAASAPRLPTPVITQAAPREETFAVAQPGPEELAQTALRQEQSAKAQEETEQRRRAEEETARQEAEQAHVRAAAAEREAQRQEEAARMLAEQEAQRAEQAQREEREQREVQAQEAQRKAEEAARQRALALEREQQEAARQAEALALQRQREEEERLRLAHEAEVRAAQRLAALKEEQERAQQQALELEARRRAEEAAREQAEAAARQRDRERMAADSRTGENMPGNALPRHLGGSLASHALNQARQLDPAMLAPVRPAAPETGNARRYSLFGRAEQDVNLRMYVESWKMKIERNGNLNYAQSSKDRARGDPVVTVAIRSDGSVEEVVINRSSGRSELDEAVRRIVRINARYSAFPPEIARRFDVIEIRRIWNFDETLRIIEEMR